MFPKTVEQFYNSIEENSKNSPLELFLADLVYLIETKKNNFSIVTENLLLVSYLANNLDEMQQIVRADKPLLAAIKTVIEVYQVVA